MGIHAYELSQYSLKAFAVGFGILAIAFLVSAITDIIREYKEDKKHHFDD